MMFVWLLLSPVCVLLARGEDLVVTTSLGPVLGSLTERAQVFRGIPYAQPPVGLLRWQLPHPVSSWYPNMLNATQNKDACPQIRCEEVTAVPLCPRETSENCLYLNIFAPLSANNGSSLPVMVNIHGGNFLSMSGSSILYDGSVFVEKGNVILVNINYRLGAFGFLVPGNPEVDAFGNFGLHDQVLALKWVHENIKHFGGDPNKVTIFGQSAGAQSVVWHLTSNESSNYFSKAIVQSCPVILPYRTREEALKLSNLLAVELDCQFGDLKCLRSKSTDQVTRAAYTITSKPVSKHLIMLFQQFGPYIDGTFVTGQPLDVFHLGQYSNKPLIIGTTIDETVGYIHALKTSRMTPIEYFFFTVALRPDRFSDVLRQYPPLQIRSSQTDLAISLSTDLVFWCSSRNLSLTMIADGNPEVWIYHWNESLPFPLNPSVSFCSGRSCHGVELVFVFATEYLGNFSFTDAERSLSDDVITYWTNFAWTGNPNQPGNKNLSHDFSPSPEPGNGTQERNTEPKTQSPLFWPRFNSALGWPSMTFQTSSRKITHDYRGSYCDFWDSIGYTVYMT